jgi:hypothetical protein
MEKLNFGIKMQNQFVWILDGKCFPEMMTLDLKFIGNGFLYF